MNTADKELSGHLYSKHCRQWLNNQLETMTHGVLQGSVLGLVLFKIIVVDVDSGIKCTFGKFANNTKLSGLVEMLEGRDAI